MSAFIISFHAFFSPFNISNLNLSLEKILLSLEKILPNHSAGNGRGEVTQEFPHSGRASTDLNKRDMGWCKSYRIKMSRVGTCFWRMDAY